MARIIFRSVRSLSPYIFIHRPRVISCAFKIHQMFFFFLLLLHGLHIFVYLLHYNSNHRIEGGTQVNKHKGKQKSNNNNNNNNNEKQIELIRQRNSKLQNFTLSKLRLQIKIKKRRTSSIWLTKRKMKTKKKISLPNVSDFMDHSRSLF